MFLDETEIYVKAGDGGNGCVSFRREKYVPKGGPDGGDGGKGGDVIIKGNQHLNSLFHLIKKHKYIAQNGKEGAGNNRFGKNGMDVIIEVPPGTSINDATSNVTLKEILTHEDSIIIAKGGHGGKGNSNFATPTNQAPRFAKPGMKGEERKLKLVLKLIADVGIIGLPNAGKSTFLSTVSAAKPKIANYPFTTLTPNLGIVTLDNFHTLIFADMPGLIENAHKGTGLGIQFLKHIERTSILLHLVDVGTQTLNEALNNYHIIRNELISFNPSLKDKNEIIALSKTDIITDVSPFANAFKPLSKYPVFPISSATNSGLKPLLSILFNIE